MPTSMKTIEFEGLACETLSLKTRCRLSTLKSPDVWLRRCSEYTLVIQIMNRAGSQGVQISDIMLYFM